MCTAFTCVCPCHCSRVVSFIKEDTPVYTGNAENGGSFTFTFNVLFTDMQSHPKGVVQGQVVTDSGELE